MKHFLVVAVASLFSFPALAQTPGKAASAPLGLKAPRVSYGLSAGATFAGRYGSATYLSPTATYQLGNRLQLFGGITYLRTMPGAVFPGAGEAGRAVQAGTNHYLLQGGGTYAVSPRLALTGSAWRDLSSPAGPVGVRVNPYAGFGNLGTGLNLRADYHITENFSVSGGVRVVQGATPGFSPLLNSPTGY
ncbi:hypothetical protein F0P96_01505 [Hymenobacter busanensis]|uniref:Uncharacterized protein n=1 Tax=Hymenobacter busanensis TaxID=2607656 RepID=A0A7L4ZTZ2_9BACT|nr:hypothetical protein [Hymenobacter busanensis]KAA9339329.1 hypothetical protein F0P96_01505 [Hymenobacter busanensis]QHJ06909.1 hypothetical protein GUY19_06245 [Hymenobacter busanensis]